MRARTGAALALACGLTAAAPATIASAAARPPAADTVMRNGYVRTVDAKDSVRQALAVRNGRIVFVGSNKGAKAYIGKGTKVVNLHGRMVMPGLQDAHVHVREAGEALISCNLHYAPLTIAQFQQTIQGCLDKTKDQEPNSWMFVNNWYRQAMLPAGADGTRQLLDALNTKRPIYVSSTDGHTKLVNSAALKVAGITAQTPDPIAGQIIRDAGGEPTGILEDSAGRLVSKLIPPPTAEENLIAGRASLKALREVGITSFMDQLSDDAAARTFASLRRSGDLTARVHLAPNSSLVTALKSPKEAVAPVLALRKRWDTGAIVPAPGITVANSGELGQDGVLQAPAQTASLLKPYFVNSGTDAAPKWVLGTKPAPKPYWPKKTLTQVVVLLMKAGITPEVHAIGDRAVRQTLDAFAAARKQLPNSDIPLSIAHAESVDPADYGRFAKLGVSPAMAFQWAKPAPDSIEGAKYQMGPERFARMEPGGILEHAGARVSVGSDWPVDTLNPWFAMEVGLTRENPDGGKKYAGRLNSARLMTRDGVVRANTINAAWVMHQDAQTGSLEVGKLADLIELDRNLDRIPAKQVHDTKVLLTMVGGKVVYEAKASR